MKTFFRFSANFSSTPSIPLFSKILLASILLGAINTSVFADGKSRPDSHAPISVMGEHSHGAGEFMFSYRFMSMTMEDNRDGSDTLENNEILGGGSNTGAYMVAPQEMTMDMHMLGLMYAPNDTITWMFMLPYLDVSMDHLIGPMHGTSPNETFTTETSGLGDFKVTSLITLEKNAEGSLLLGMGLNLPTGSIDEEDEILSMPALGETQLPFPMQLGSGTYDLLPSVTYNRVYEKRSWGTQLSGVLRLGTNDNGYTLGNRGQLQAWHAWLINHELSASTRLSYSHWDNIDGDDDTRDLPQTMNMGMMTMSTVPTIDPQNQGGERFEGGLGLNGIYGEGEHRVALEVAIPLHQRLDGPQMETDLIAILGYQKAF
jgi:hypothetical protein